MKTKLEISKEEAIKLYADAPKELKSIFESTFGLEVFKPKKITDQINDLNDVFKILRISYITTPFPNPKTKEEKSINAQFYLFKIVEAYNEGWVPDWNNVNQCKYYPYLYKDSDGGWAALYNDWNYCHYSPSGLAFKSSELALDAISKFRDLYNDYFMVS